MTTLVTIMICFEFDIYLNTLTGTRELVIRELTHSFIQERSNTLNSFQLRVTGVSELHRHRHICTQSLTHNHQPRSNGTNEF